MNMMMMMKMNDDDDDDDNDDDDGDDDNDDDDDASMYTATTIRRASGIDYVNAPMGRPPDTEDLDGARPHVSIGAGGQERPIGRKAH